MIICGLISKQFFAPVRKKFLPSNEIFSLYKNCLLKSKSVHHFHKFHESRPGLQSNVRLPLIFSDQLLTLLTKFAFKIYQWTFYTGIFVKLLSIIHQQISTKWLLNLFQPKLVFISRAAFENWDIWMNEICVCVYGFE